MLENDQQQQKKKEEEESKLDYYFNISIVNNCLCIIFALYIHQNITIN